MRTSWTEERVKGNDEWLTPPYIIDALGKFDLDPCAPVGINWKTADEYYTIEDNGLMQEWWGRIWLNPPYGYNKPKEWLSKLSHHGNGIALLFARVETKIFFNYVWGAADSVFFIKGRLRFYDSKGYKAPNDAGTGSVLVAYGQNNVDILSRTSSVGKHIVLK